MPQPKPTAEPLPLPGPSHTLPASDVERALDTGADGLNDDEARRRLAHYGPNELELEREEPWWRILVDQFRDPLIYILLIAAALTAVISDYKDTAVILAVLALNAVIGFVQEYRARKAMRALAKLATPKADVVRGGTPRAVPGRELVPGDVVLLASGSRVPADLRLTSVRDLEVDESALTGESAPVRKTTDPLEGDTLVPGDRVNSAFAGTVVTRGRGRGVVVRTGPSTELGRIASAVREVGPTETPLQERSARLGRRIGLAIVVLALLIVIVDLLRGASVFEILLTAVAMAVAAIPEALPVVLTVTLAVGVRRMAHREAIIRSLPAVETLGSTTAIGSDKTGTLTKNEMTVRAVWAAGTRHDVTGTGYSAGGGIERDGRPIEPVGEPALRRALLVGVLANETDPAAVAADEPRGDPTELALYVAAAKGGLPPAETRARHPEVDLLPFEPERTFMATLNEGPEARAIYLKGAPETVLSRCDRQVGETGEAPLHADAVREVAARLGAGGYRVLAMAYRRTDADRLDGEALAGGFVFAGLQAMEDPVRPEAVDAVAAARRAGIRVLMLTGDHVDTARAIGRRLGLGGGEARAVEGRHIETLSDEALDQIIRDVDVYARVAPEHKLRLVERLKATGDIVGVTGDGVNDAPALRAAHIGIAMGRAGTDVAREASDMVLADDNFATITAAVEEGRVVFANVRKVTYYLLTTGAGIILTILASVLAGWPVPFLPAQVLWINLVVGGIQDVTLALEPGEPGLLDRPPRAPDEGIVTVPLVRRFLVAGLVLAAGTLAVFWSIWRATNDITLAQTAAMTQMVMFQFYHRLNCRSLDRSIFRIPVGSNPYLFASLGAAVIAHLAVLYVPFMQSLFRTVPLPSGLWGLVLAVGAAVVVVAELSKWLDRRAGRTVG